MYEDANTAASIVAAVLETAGYVAQAQILQTFGGFWQKFGFLLYLVAAACGLLSVVLTGSYRGARLLLVAPTLFYFMVMERATLPPAVWRFGDREAASIVDRFSGPLESYRPGNNVEVARVFAIYTRLSSQFMGELTRIIMKFQDDDSFLFIARNQAMYSLMSLSPQKPETDTMLTYSMYQQCQDMFNALTELSGRPFSVDHLNLLRASAKMNDSNAINALASTELTRNALLQKYQTAANTKMMTPDIGMRDFMLREVSMSLSGNGRNYASDFALGDAATFVATGGGSTPLTCGQGLQVFEDAAIKEGTWFQKYIEELNFDKKVLANPTSRTKLCNAIAEKFHPKYVEGPDCNLGMVAMVVMLRNRLLKEGISALVDSARTQMNIIPSPNKRYCIDTLYNQGGMSTLKRKPGEEVNYRLDKVQEIHQERDRTVAYGADSADEGCVVFSTEAPGMMQTVIDQQHNDARGLLQKIYSFALNLPYYQGVMLFWLAFGYPFMALFLLIPGRGEVFLYAPLAWIWLKSWDVGFAIVTVFDKVLWKVLPKSELPYSLSAPANDILPDLLGAVLRVDPTYDVHAHFNYIALAMLAVPTLTGALIMRGKTAVFSAFVAAPGNLAKSDSYGRGRAVSAQYLSHERSFRAEQMEGMLFQGISSVGAGLSNNPALGDAKKWGAVGGTVSAMSNFLQQSAPLSSGIQPQLRTVLDGVKTGSAAAFDVFEADVKAQAEYQAAFHPLFGIAGDERRLLFASLSGLDGNLSWTSQGAGSSRKVYEKDLDALLKRFDLGAKFAAGALQAAQAQGAVLAPGMVGGAGLALDGVLTGAAWGYSWGAPPQGPTSQVP